MQIGERLREAREARDLSLDDIQEMTKIQKRYLVAIEQDDFHALPGKFYARAFIKEYALMVELDPAEVLEGFDESSIQTEEEESVQYSRMERSKRPRDAKGTSILSFLPTVIVIILVIGIVFVAWTLYQKALNKSEEPVDNPSDDEIIRNVDEDKDKADEEDKNADNQEDEEKDADEEEEEASEDEFSVEEEGSGSSPLSTMDFTYGGDKVEVTFEVEQSAYVALQAEDESYLQEGTLEEGSETDPIDVSDEERIYFNIGNTSGVKVFLNDVEMKYPVDPSTSVHQKIWVNLKKAD